jgi:hypothetical protein
LIAFVEIALGCPTASHSTQSEAAARSAGAAGAGCSGAYALEPRAPRGERGAAACASPASRRGAGACAAARGHSARADRRALAQRERCERIADGRTAASTTSPSRLGRYCRGPLNAKESRWPEFCQVEREGRLFIVTLNRPEVMNSLHPPANFELEAVFDDFVADPDLWSRSSPGAGDARSPAGNDLKFTAQHGGRLELIRKASRDSPRATTTRSP